jgi:protein-S-isoprenylcysteine O-methyltransferase Ste14
MPRTYDRHACAGWTLAVAAVLGLCPRAAAQPVSFVRVADMTDQNVARHLAAATVIGGAVLSAYAYGRAGRGYAAGKDTAIPSPWAFRFVYRYALASTLAAALGAIYSDAPWLLKVPCPTWLSTVGIALTAAALAMLLHAQRVLGHAYSPCFDSFIPANIVTRGVYRHVRHPIYAANLALLMGIFLATGSGWVLLNVAIILPFYCYCVRAEERALAERFPGYGSYQARTGRFLPRLGGMKEEG